MEVQKVLSEQLELIKPSQEVCEKIDKISKEFCSELKENLKNKKIKSNVFIGGSLAKGTLVRKKIYDIDVFVRFDMSYGDKKISKLLGRVLGAKIMGKEVKRVHGSRDYYQVLDGNILIEVIPVLNIKKPEQAVNVTDLSYFHVNYVLGKIKNNKKLVDGIRLAKTFVHAQGAYGAESYIHGFSGYALELLICHYGGFLKFVNEVVGFSLDNGDGKIVIDDAKHYKNEEEVLIEMNKSKIVGPLVLIDPTFKERNAGSSLSKKTFYKFQNDCRDFLVGPSSDFFKVKDVGAEFDGLKNVKVISVKTNKQAGDIAGTKSKKFFDFFGYQLKKEFDVKKQGFDYDDEKNVAKFYFVVGRKRAEIVRGPPVTNVHNLTKFKKIHPSAYVRGKFAYFKNVHNMDFDKWFSGFLRDEKKVMRGMGVKKVELGK